MALTPQTAQDFINNLQAYITSYNAANNTNIDIRQGTVFKDIVVDAPAQEFALVDADIATTSEMQAPIVYVGQIPSSSIDDFGQNFDVPRLGQSYSQGFEDFIATSQPIGNITINAGISIAVPSTATSPAINFVTTQTVTLNVNNLSQYQFVDTDGNTKWKITVSIIAVSAGANGDVGAFTITQLNQPIAGITSIRNPISTFGGSNVETDQHYASRLQQKLSGNNVGTVNGITSLLSTNTFVDGLDVVTPPNPILTRNQFGGSVDVYVLGQQLVTTTESDVFNSASGFIKLINVPIVDVSTITGTVSGNPYTFTLGTDVLFNLDTGLYSGSSLENDTLTFPLSGVQPDNGSLVNTSLTYNQLIPNLQSILKNPNNQIVAADILVREAITILINVFAQITITAGQTSSTVLAAVSTNISTYLEGLGLGQNVEAAEIISAIVGTPGVASLNIPSFLPSQDVIIQENQVARPGVLNIQIINTIL